MATEHFSYNTIIIIVTLSQNIDYSILIVVKTLVQKRCIDIDVYQF
jgi:hypothetical protein